MTAIQQRTKTVTYIDERVYIERSPEDVFAFVLDVTKEPLWQTGVKSSELVDGEIRVGSRIRTVTEFLGEELVLTAEVTSLDAPNHVTFKLVDGPFDMEAQWRLAPEGEGTRLTMEATKAMTGLFEHQGVDDAKTTELFSAQLRSDMERLKAILEG